MDPLSILGFAVCLEMAIIAGLWIIFDAGEVSTPTGISGAAGTTTLKQRVYNIDVYECGQRQEAVNVIITTETKSSSSSSSPASPPSL
ncbi:unnamed protein product, partial [Laminaria digitata]